ncbi:hypothetical protein SKAU_G00355550 [Synaphobranchus kaupii]|uniref:MIF4G domain-containing protein n=1 Tax=Synaphobranchus kaupii TaxID=118154 RepID=A0A9Q1EH96_SYNKA|nr:hypothetical protein SKAU_G00355550 [Synaphobranchus kaupii]
MTDDFDRAPGAGRNRLKPNSPGLGEQESGRLPEPDEGDAKAPFFNQREPLRQPRTSPPSVENNNLSAAGGDRRIAKASHAAQSYHSPAALKAQTGNSLARNSSLSANAPEFYPKNYTPYQESTYEDGSDSYYPEVTLAELVQEYLNHLNASPASFELEIEAITATLNGWVTTEETLHELLELIYTQSTSIPNFAYTGARLCNYLSHHLTLSPPGGNFRKLLLQRCQTEYEQRAQALYLNLEVKSRKGPPSRAEILLSALKDLTDALFSNPVDGNLICAVKLLKLTGSVLEDAWKESGKSHMDSLVGRIENIVLDASCSRDVKHMLLRLVELRSSDWGRVRAASASSEATPDNDPNYFMRTARLSQLQIQEYSEKYQEILDRENYFPDFEENGNEDYSDEDDEMDPEIEEAFENRTAERLFFSSLALTMSGVDLRVSVGEMRQSLCVALLLLALAGCGPVLSEARKGQRSPAGGTDRTSPPGGLEGQRGAKADAPEPSISPELEFLADFVGKHRLWVITAPSHADNYLRMMEKQIQDMEPEGLSCRLAERDTLVVTIIQNAMMEGKIRRSSFQGEPTEEAIDSDMVTKLLHYLDLEEQVFAMLILKKNLLVGERFPYPVRVAAILEVIDQLPVRKLEKLTRRGSTERCKVIKKRVVVRKRGPAKKVPFSPQRRGAVAKQRKPLDKKAVLRSQVQNILNGRSRFVIRKDSAGNRGTQAFTPESGRKYDGEPQITGDRGSTSQGGGATKQDGPARGEGSPDGTNSSGVKGDADSNGEKSKSKSKKKGKGKKKKGKGRKSQRDANDRDKKSLKSFLEKLQGKRRLLVISAPGENSPAYLQQKADNEQNHCHLALRKVSMATILGPENNSTLHLHHYLLDTEPPFDAGPAKQTDLGLIAQMRKEYGILPKDFSFVLTDYDLKLTKVFQSPISTPVMMDTIDSFPTREHEKKREKNKPAVCPTPGAQGEAENSLLRFMSKRRLLIISTPSEDDYFFQQQLQALNGQSCHLGIRHFALLKLVGAGPTASGSVELLPLNGKSQSEHEPLSGDVVNGLRGHLKITREYFSMLVVGKDGEVKAWFPSPMWSLVNIYDLVDSMELRQQEHRLQSTLGIHCPEESDGGYEDEGEEGYLYRRAED